MSSRSIRRAAERKALKDARETILPTGTIDACDQSPAARPVSEARLEANSANAQRSTGPRTPEGRAKASVDAKGEAAFLSEPKIQQVSGLTGRTVLLPSDDVDAYRQHVQDFADEFHPVGARESELVQAVADHAWRLNRIASLEMALFAFGHEQFAEQFADRGAMQGSFTQMHTFLHYEKQIRNLQIQEARLRRNREKDIAELRRLQQDRFQKEQNSIPVQSPETSQHSRIAAAASHADQGTARESNDDGFDFALTGDYTEIGLIQRFDASAASDSELPESDSRAQIAA